MTHPGRRRRRPVAALAALTAAAVAAVAVVVVVITGGGGDRGTAARQPTAVPNGARAAAAYDFDGDGRPTVVAGMPAVQGGTGGVAVIGVARPIGAPEPQRGAEFGAAVASADFDRDGHADLAVGAPGADSGDRTRREGAVTVLYRATGGLNKGRSATLPGPGGDEPYQSARYGAALAAGDLDDDGYADLVVGVPSGAVSPDDLGSGMLVLLFGGRDGLTADRAQTIRRPRTSLQRFGTVLALGDVDGDRRLDLVEGAADHAFYCRGVAGGPVACHRIGASLTGGPTALAVGDVTGDGLGDIVAGVVPGAAGAGELRIWRGTRRGPAPHPITLSQATPGVMGHNQPGDAFGAALGIADLDGNRFADIVVGAPGEDESAGRITQVRGARSGVEPGAEQSYSQATPGVPRDQAPGNRFGAQLMLLDLDGDGRRDLVASAPGERAVITLPAARGGFTGSGARLHRLRGGAIRLGVG